MVMSWINSSDHPTVLVSLIGKTSSHYSWTTFHDRYASQSTRRLLQLRSELMNTHRGLAQLTTVPLPLLRHVMKQSAIVLSKPFSWVLNEADTGQPLLQHAVVVVVVMEVLIVEVVVLSPLCAISIDL
ncbi:uncharacterized protein LOC126604368 [Malus sylvestris]|uniref:uncharacterized protein LOC126604368 n=1 Tax=Malus sylvestris TaxID=3752 RepID=UPI0021AC3407|nr:uncharacterized protein LOC126604368 [Malus sylvestris]